MRFITKPTFYNRIHLDRCQTNPSKSVNVQPTTYNVQRTTKLAVRGDLPVCLAVQMEKSHFVSGGQAAFETVAHVIGKRESKKKQKQKPKQKQNNRMEVGQE